MSKVFLSTTFEDLKDYRLSVYHGLRQLGLNVIGLEDYGGTEERPLKILDDVAAADIYVGIFAHRYGYVPEGTDNPERLSITHLEYRQAVRHNIPCYIFLLSDDAPWPPKFIDRGEPGRKLAAFRRELTESRVVRTFSSVEELTSQVIVDIASSMRQQAVSEEPSERFPREFDVFFSYNSNDRDMVRLLAARLERDGIHVWMDVTALKGGDDWERETQSAFALSDIVAMFVGPGGIGDQQNVEVQKALDRKSRPEGEQFRLIPVLLPDARIELLPPPLSKYFWVDFRDSLDNPEAYSRLKSAILERKGSPTPASPRLKPVIDEQVLEMLPELLFRLVARLRERPEMLRSLDATAFWAAVRKIQPEASTIEDLRSVNAQLSSEPASGALWTAWMRNTRATELTALLQHPDMTVAS